MAVVVKFEGGRELERALGELPKATERNTLTRALKKAGQKMEDRMAGGAPVLTGAMGRSVVMGPSSRLTSPQKRDAKKEGKHLAEVHIGTADPGAISQEFGNFAHPAQPFGRPAWDESKDHTLKTFASELATEIEKSRARLAKKAGKLG